ncbi:hypothetical protein PDE_00234 [Penicillium oxalicum 114-2]|uniref:Uncharacterized protein n=1 Tax=Penicillium oxalicum (strain 114-2 / CGMCC 5302) TaxID=933388 RepID=S7Z9F3_PENO1|nr:hypothetical protein PDE_00234 [Penicillium oxalicum 114-2]
MYMALENRVSDPVDTKSSQGSAHKLGTHSQARPRFDSSTLAA